MRAQTRFNVPDTHAAVKRRQRRRHHRSRVSLHQHPVWTELRQHLVDAHQDASSGPGELLIRLHYVEVGVRTQIERAQNRVEHLTMLSRDAQNRLHLGMAFDGGDDRRHFDGLRSGADKRHDFQHGQGL